MKKRWKCTVCGQIFYGDRPPVPCPVCGADLDAFIELPAEEEPVVRRDTNERFVIVGGGAAALEAAKAIRARNFLARILLIAGENVIPYNRPALSDVLEDGYSFESIALEEYDYYARNKIELSLNVRAERADAQNKRVYLSDGREIAYDKLLIATGANPFCPIARPEGAVELYTLRSFDDALRIAENFRGKRALVVGGGILGLEAAWALKSGLNCAVCVVELGERILPLQADEEAAARLQKGFEDLGIHVRTGVTVKTLTKDGAVLTDESEIACDCVLASIGVRSEVALAKQMGLELGRAIVVDEGMRASIPDVYAAGDCAQFAGRSMALWSVATEQGRVAGANMAGDHLAFSAPVPATAYEAPSIRLFSAGTLSGENLAQYTRLDERAGVYRRLYFKENALVGVVFWGDTAKSADALSMISEGAGPERAALLL